MLKIFNFFLTHYRLSYENVVNYSKSFQVLFSPQTTPPRTLTCERESTFHEWNSLIYGFCNFATSFPTFSHIFCICISLKSLFYAFDATDKVLTMMCMVCIYYCKLTRIADSSLHSPESYYCAYFMTDNLVKNFFN